MDNDRTALRALSYIPGRRGSPGKSGQTMDLEPEQTATLLKSMLCADDDYYVLSLNRVRLSQILIEGGKEF